ncbi:MAG: phenylacetate--CoA ligase family protein [Planctomycetota bacterium]|jgi:phenylacetate-CoA ligase
MRTDHSIEFQSIETIEQFNNRLLREHVQYCYEHSPYYRRLFEKNGLKAEHIKAKNDLHLLPLTLKEHLEEYAEDFLCVPEQDIVDICQTSGTTGKPLIMFQTASDLERVGYNEAISLRAAGVTENDRTMIACALGRCFMAGLAYFEGVRRIGAAAVRTGSGNPAILIQSALLYRPSVIICVPSQALLMAEAIRQSGQDPAQLGVRLLICIGEPIRKVDLEHSTLGEKLRKIWNCDVVGTYAGTEIATSFTECSYGCGGHFHPELITVEIVDENGKPVPPGQPGEVIATPLQVTGMPLLRYCTGDIGAYYADPCPCGRNTYRLGPIIGRKQQKMKIRGTMVYPGAIFLVLQDIPEVKNYYLEVYGEYELSERVRVVVGIEEAHCLSADSIAEKIRAYIRVKPEVVVETAANVAARTIQEGKRKETTFFDYRNN